VLRNITGIHDLCADKYGHGAGINTYCNDGALDAHVDYKIHPHYLNNDGKSYERRINLLVYFSEPDWREEWGGELELWSAVSVKAASGEA